MLESQSDDATTTTSSDVTTSVMARRYLADVTHALLMAQTDPLPMCLLLVKHAALFSDDANHVTGLTLRFLPRALSKVSVRVREGQYVQAQLSKHLLGGIS